MPEQMRRSTLFALLVIPNAAAAIITGGAVWNYPDSTLTIGTFAGVFYVAYGALAAPWISGYLDDRKVHSEVLNRLFFRQFESWSLGDPAVDPTLNRWWGADKFNWHRPMAVTARYRIERGGPFQSVSTQPTLLSVFPSVKSHLASYPELNNAVDEAVGLVQQYNKLRPAVLEILEGLVRSELSREYPKLIDQNQHRPSAASTPGWFDSRIVAAAVYLQVLSNLKLRPFPLPELQRPDPGAAGWIGFKTNAVAIKSPDVDDLSVERFGALVTRVAAAREVRDGVQRLSDLEKAAWDPIGKLDRGFDLLGTRIELGQRIEGICPAVGY